MAASSSSAGAALFSNVLSSSILTSVHTSSASVAACCSRQERESQSVRDPESKQAGTYDSTHELNAADATAMNGRWPVAWMLLTESMAAPIAALSLSSTMQANAACTSRSQDVTRRMRTHVPC